MHVNVLIVPVNVIAEALSEPLMLDCCGPLGFYMFIETSKPRVEGDKARLMSPTFNVNSKSISSSASNNPTYCVTFYYHMYGKHIGERPRGYLLLLVWHIRKHVCGILPNHTLCLSCRSFEYFLAAERSDGDRYLSLESYW